MYSKKVIIRTGQGIYLHPQILCMYVFVLKTCNLSVCLPPSLIMTLSILVDLLPYGRI